MSPYARGVALCLVAGLVWSTSGVTFRTLEQPDVWKVSFWRSGTMAVSVLLLLLWRYRGGVLGAFRGIGGIGLLAAGFIAGANILVMFSLSLTTVANTMFMLAAQPLLAALLAWILLREGVGGRTVIAMVVALAGVGVMVADALGAGDLLGNLLALATALSFALFVVALRAGRSADMLPVLLVAGCLVSAVGFAAAGGEVGMSLHDILLCVVMGSVQVTLGLVLFVAGSRLLSAGEVTLLSQTEVVLGPVWVFLVYAEAPSMLTLAGGALVLAAVVGQALLGGRAQAR